MVSGTCNHEAAFRQLPVSPSSNLEAFEGLASTSSRFVIFELCHILAASSSIWRLCNHEVAFRHLRRLCHILAASGSIWRYCIYGFAFHIFELRHILAASSSIWRLCSHEVAFRHLRASPSFSTGHDRRPRRWIRLISDISLLIMYENASKFTLNTTCRK